MSTADVAACLSMDHLLIITDYNAIACDGSNSFELTWSHNVTTSDGSN